MSAKFTVTTEGLAKGQRLRLISDAADQLFNLETDLGGISPAQAMADIQVSGGASARFVAVRTSASTVSRAADRVRQAQQNNILLYLVDSGSATFQNARGEEFVTQAGTLFVGSQDAPYRAVSLSDWNFRTISIPERMFTASAGLVRDGGYRPLGSDSALHALLSSYTKNLLDTASTLAEEELAASIRALDHLVSCVLRRSSEEPEADFSGRLSAARLREALAHIEHGLTSPEFGPATVARRLNSSVRQLHRLFEAHGLTLAGETRRLRLQMACRLLADSPELSVTAVAMACGFGSMPTFYRLFKEAFGRSALEWRAAEVPRG